MSRPRVTALLAVGVLVVLAALCAASPITHGIRLLWRAVS